MHGHHIRTPILIHSGLSITSRTTLYRPNTRRYFNYGCNERASLGNNPSHCPVYEQASTAPMTLVANRLNSSRTTGYRYPSTCLQEIPQPRSRQHSLARTMLHRIEISRKSSTPQRANSSRACARASIPRPRKSPGKWEWAGRLEARAVSAGSTRSQGEIK